VRPSDQPFAGQIALGLRTWEGQHGVPPGLTSAARVEAFVGQLVASDRRRRFINSVIDLPRARRTPEVACLIPTQLPF
jgi:hypothetical protein